MADICVKVNGLQYEPQNIKKYIKTLNNQILTLHSLKDGVNLGSSTEAVKKSIQNASQNLNVQYTNIKVLAEQLELIIKEYQQVEQKLTDKSIEIKEITKAEGNDNSNNDDSDSYFMNAVEQLFKGEYYDGETNALGDIMSFIVSFIPGLNCLADARDLFADIQHAIADGKLTSNEVGLLALDVISVVGDVVSFSAVLKGIKEVREVTKATKLAKTAQKTAAKEAKQLAKGMKKEAKQLAKKADKAAKVAAEKGTRKTVRKATKIAQNAERTAKDAKKASEMAKKAKEVAKQASRTHNTNLIKESARKAAEDIASKDINEEVNNLIKDDCRNNLREEMEQ